MSQKQAFVVTIYNGGGYEIDKQLIVARDGNEALLIYIKEYKPILEIDDTIKITKEW